MRHIPNILTVLRFASVPLAVWMIIEGMMGWAFWLFLAAAITDAIDGALARLFKAQSWLGTWLDPAADKALLVGVFVTLGWLGHIPLWLAVLVVLRDVLIVLYALAYMLAGAFKGTPLLISKVNTLAQIVLAAAVLGRLGYGWGGPLLVEAMIEVVAVTTIASGAAYLLASTRKVSASGNP